MTLAKKAERMAEKAHKDQVRKTDGSSYIRHPRAVADILLKHGFGDAVVAAGWLHDTLEDTDLSEDVIRRELGDRVAHMVSALSEDKSLPWEARKQAYADRIRQAPVEVRAVVAADKIHNLRDLLDFYHRSGGQAVWDKFNRGREEKLWFEKLMLAALGDDPLQGLTREYAELVAKMEELD